MILKKSTITCCSEGAREKRCVVIFRVISANVVLSHIQILFKYLQIWSNCKVGKYVSAVREALCKEEHMEKKHLLLGEDVGPTWLLSPPLWSGTALLGTPRTRVHRAACLIMGLRNR